MWSFFANTKYDSSLVVEGIIRQTKHTRRQIARLYDQINEILALKWICSA